MRQRPKLSDFKALFSLTKGKGREGKRNILVKYMFGSKERRKKKYFNQKHVWFTRE